MFAKTFSRSCFKPCNSKSSAGIYFPATANSDSIRSPGGALAREGWIFAIQGYAPLYHPVTKNI